MTPEPAKMGYSTLVVWKGLKIVLMAGTIHGLEKAYNKFTGENDFDPKKAHYTQIKKIRNAGIL